MKFNILFLMLIIFYNSFFSLNTVLCDVPRRWQMGFQDPATPIMEGIIDFHNHLMFFLILILTLVCWLLFNIIYRFKDNNDIAKFSHGSLLEIVWTIVPTIILMIIAVPSFALLYSMETQITPRFTFKAIGHQWYWSYEYSDYIKLGLKYEFDSYMIQEDDLVPGTFRLLEVDHRVVLPSREYLRLLLTSQDVIHSWAIPSFGIKLDAIPGRVNQAFFFIKREGTFYGQCSEICGVNHGFMPIVVRAVKLNDFNLWVLRHFEHI